MQNVDHDDGDGARQRPGVLRAGSSAAVAAPEDEPVARLEARNPRGHGHCEDARPAPEPVARVGAGARGGHAGHDAGSKDAPAAGLEPATCRLPATAQPEPRRLSLLAPDVVELRAALDRSREARQRAFADLAYAGRTGLPAATTTSRTGSSSTDPDLEGSQVLHPDLVGISQRLGDGRVTDPGVVGGGTLTVCLDGLVAAARDPLPAPGVIHAPGTWEARCSCGWEAATDHEVHLWQLTRQHHLDHWVDDPPAFQWHYRCSCAWLSGWHGIKSELAAAVAHHRARASRQR